MTRFPSRNRQSIRLRNYDYSFEGVYFLTICAYQRENLFVSDSIRELIQKSWNHLPDRFPNIQLDEFVIMPNHVHGIVWIVSTETNQFFPNTNVGAGSSRPQMYSKTDVGAPLGAPK